MRAISICLVAFVLIITAEAEAKSPLKKKRLEYTLISSEELTEVHSTLRDSLKVLLPEAKEVELDYKSRRAKNLIAELKIQFIPYVVFEDEVALEDAFFHMVKHDMIEKRVGRYVIPEAMLRMAEVILLNRQRIPNRLDIFVMTGCSSCERAEVELINFIREKNLDVDIKLRHRARVDEFGVSSKYGAKGIRESLRQIAIQKYYPDKFWDFLVLIKDKPTEEAAKELDISLQEIDAKKDEALELLKEDVKEAKLLKIKSTPTFIWENIYLIPSLEGLKRHKPFSTLK